MAKLTLNEVLKSPVDWIYIFADDKAYIPYLSGKFKTVVRTKKAYQVKTINTAAVENGSTFADWSKQIRDGIINTYGMTPADILVRLANGEAVAGKNWTAGVYGIGSLREGWQQNQSYTVDKSTGKILQNGKPVTGQTAVYSSTGKVVGYTVSVESEGTTTQYQSRKSGKYYYAGSYSDSTGIAQNADGSAYTPATAESLWQNVLTFAPYISQFINWIASLLGVRVINSTQVSASQSDWSTTDNTADHSFFWILAAGAGALLLMK